MTHKKHKFTAVPVSLIMAVLLTIGSAMVSAEEQWPAEPPAEAPAHWGAVSANFEEIP